MRSKSPSSCLCVDPSAIVTVKPLESGRMDSDRDSDCHVVIKLIVIVKLIVVVTDCDVKFKFTPGLGRART